MRSAARRMMHGMKAMFACVAVLAIAYCSVAAAAGDVAESPASPKPLVAGVWISGQITPKQVEELKAQGIKTIVDLRPDGEASDQPSSGVVEAAAHEAGLAFSYAPVRDKEVPPAAVDAVSRAILRPDNPVLIYCRSGGRATRIWAVAEASRLGGLDAEAIQAVADSAGQPLDDLKEQITALVSARQKLP